MAERVSDAEYSTDPGRYRRTGEIPRQRVAFFDEGEAESGLPGSGPDMYQQDWEGGKRRKGRRRARGRTGRTVTLLVAVTTVGAAVGGVVAFGPADLPGISRVAVDAALQQRSNAPEPAARGAERPTPAPSVSASKPAASTKSAKASKSPSPKPPEPPEPVSGLNQTQMNNAAVIVDVAQDLGLPRRAMLVAMMTGMQESSLRNLANPTVPGSLDRPNEGSGDNFDSLGVFQQRPSQGWGSVKQLMNPRYAADAFYDKLVTIDDWEDKDLGEAAQAVQRSGVPDGYDKHEKRAAQIVDALL
ncbi:hypothetical protein [Actinoplanes couchii]|uniref:hypothetical protein n=1 Tax=Actinoplanes couchii TaxID=403638 RepID=UPI001944D8FF|nr:hypothetical protein [Actinoplanes couchii]MDR6317326.1 hypothetical protein [Actinoplanes couchii]